MKYGLEPLLDNKTIVLILGSLPSDQSIIKNQYYGNPGNDFWKLLSESISFDLVNLSYYDRIHLLKENKIGLWDIYRSGERDRSLDSNILKPKLNDFSFIKKHYPTIKQIFLNGKKAGEMEEYFRDIGFEVTVLPSSSGANRKNGDFRQLAWKKISLLITKQ